jgi:hypothetical protein
MSAPPPAPRRRLTVSPSEAHARIALRESLVVMAPLVRWLLRNGVHYGAFADALKSVFIGIAREELANRTDAAPTASAISVLSGVHRKDVRALADKPQAEATALRSVPLASQVFTRWLTDSRWCAGPGQPKPLPRIGAQGSFEALARELSTDVHPRTVLDELVRLGLVVVDGERVVPQAQLFVPASGLEDLAALFAANVADHIASAVHNMTTEDPRMLENSVFADGLSEESARDLAETARALWARAFEDMVRQAQQHVDADASRNGNTRIRFGVYFHADPVPAAPDQSAPDLGRSGDHRD